MENEVSMAFILVRTMLIVITNHKYRVSSKRKISGDII
ncbi:unnamed protein product [Penicillium roqueforti FM164]|uniref:Uncharacterized protein n=1 Tax=Penicillium roqueforti (strain FM164) TaxID=1365484 RepID=W6QQ23_PENRF|nr:unnamed protein product [Penicillium roqueforti FM164]